MNQLPGPDDLAPGTTLAQVSDPDPDRGGGHRERELDERLCREEDRRYLDRRYFAWLDRISKE